jgi:hypothetical protein
MAGIDQSTSAEDFEQWKDELAADIREARNQACWLYLWGSHTDRGDEAHEKVDEILAKVMEKLGRPAA